MSVIEVIKDDDAVCLAVLAVLAVLTGCGALACLDVRVG